MPTKHTPGPWTMEGPTLKGNGYNIGSVNSHRTTEGAANARLIELAPDMLVVLKAAEQSLRYLGGTLHADRCLEIIAKIEGV